MEVDLGLMAGGGGLSGLSGDGSGTTASRVEAVVEQDYMGVSSEGSSYAAEEELELGLGLSLGSGCGGVVKPRAAAARGDHRRFLTAKDLPSAVPSHKSSTPSVAAAAAARFPSAGRASAAAAVSGTKRAAADSSVAQEAASPPGASQVVGWPPIRTYRMNSLVNQSKTPTSEEDKSDGENYTFKDASKKKAFNGSNKNNTAVQKKGHLGFVKVNMDGLPIGRKVDLNSHTCYESLAHALEDMFLRTTTTMTSTRSGVEKEQTRNRSRLLDGTSDFVLTYEDKEGDWMLVGDVPWEMFLNTVKRLRIMKTSDANGLAPRQEEGGERRRSKPI